DLRAWGQRQHGAIDQARSIALSIAARQSHGAPFAARVGKPFGRNRDRTGSAGDVAASLHRGRSAGADNRGDDHGLAPWARAPAEPLSAPPGAPRNPVPRHRPRRDIPAAIGFADCRSYGLDKSRMGAPPRYTSRTCKADAGKRDMT